MEHEAGILIFLCKIPNQHIGLKLEWNIGSFLVPVMVCKILLSFVLYLFWWSGNIYRHTHTHIYLCVCINIFTKYEKENAESEIAHP